jgi:sarcosine oxidase delta subunit
VNEFHTADGSFHQVDLFFRANPLGDVAEGWMDSEGVVNRHLWVNRAEATDLRIKPDSLIRMAFEGGAGALYDPLEMIVS